MTDGQKGGWEHEWVVDSQMWVQDKGLAFGNVTERL